ncbi:hypothetical protein EJB05_51772, partial [Eragrostis curvula]
MPPLSVKSNLHAVAASEVDIYYGTNATINLWQPTLGRPNDFSLAQLWIMAWSSWNQDLNTIEAGWQFPPWRSVTSIVNNPFQALRNVDFTLSLSLSHLNSRDR